MAKLNIEKKAMFFERMSLMLANSMSPKEVFEYCAEEFESIEKKLLVCAQKMDDGTSIVSAMESVGLLSKTELTSLHSAELSGELPSTLNTLAEYCETYNEQVRSVINKTMPNLIYLLAALGVMYGLMLFVIPSIGENIRPDQKAQFMVFKIAEHVTYFHQNYSLYALCGAIVFFVWLYKYSTSLEGKKHMVSIMLSTPYLKKGVISLSLGLWSKQASSMLKSGISFNEVVELTKDMLPDQLAFGLIQTREDVQRLGWNSALNKSKWHQMDARRAWPPEFFGALKAGGDTGRLDITLINLAKSLLRTSERVFENATSKFSSLTFFTAAGAVATVVISVITAMMSSIA